MQSSNNIIRNNITAYGLSLSSNTVATKSNNITIGAISDYSNYFINATNLAQPGNFDLHSKPGSPAIDSGTNTNAPSVDFDGNSRPQGLSTDCGAYEYNVVTTDISSHSKQLTNLTVYPNPTKKELNIEFNNGNNIKSYAIYNLVGELIKTENTNDLSLKINLENLIPGIYFLQAKSENGVELVKIIKE